MTLLDLIQHNIDVSLMIFQHIIDMSDLEVVSVVCKASNHILNNTEQGRQLWLNLAIQATTTGGVEGFNETEIRSRFQQMIHGRQEFFWHIRTLVCPWHTEGRELPVRVREMDFDSQFLFFADADETRLQIQGRDQGSMLAATFPARMLSDSERGHQNFVSQIRVAQEWVVPTLPKLDSSNQQLQQQVAQKMVVPDFSHDRGCTHRYFPIHGGAFAVVESFSPFFDNDEYSDHGIYFISHLSKRVLRHIKFEDASDVHRFCILSRPFEMWIMSSMAVVYHGPSCVPRSDEEWEYERMDEALWMAGRGDAQGAIDYLNFYGIGLDQPSLISNRTILHYAAKEGHAETVRQLLRAGFKAVDSVDDFSHTALFLAVSELHLDVVEVLLKEGNANPLAGEPCLSNVGEFIRFRPYAASVDRTKDEIARIVPAIVKLLIDKDPGVIEHSDFEYFSQDSVISSPNAMRMLCTAGSKPTLTDACHRFGTFRNRVQELSAVKTLYMLVREFDLDINHCMCDGARFNEEPGVIFLAENAVSEAVIMAIDSLGADPTTRGKNGRTIRQIAQERASRRPVDQEGQRILAYLDARGL